MFKIAICDDSKEICDSIESIILNYQEGSGINFDTEVFYTGESLYKYLQCEGSFNLIFLDIQLDKISGIDVGKIIRNRFDDHNTEIVFISGKTEYSMELFNLQPLNFLIKPINSTTVISNLELALQKWGDDSRYFTFKSIGQTTRIKYTDILYFESSGRVIKLVTTNGTDCFYGRLCDIVAGAPNHFLQTHKSSIINMSKIKAFDHDSVTMENNAKLKISKTYQKDFKDKLREQLVDRGILR